MVPTLRRNSLSYNIRYFSGTSFITPEVTIFKYSDKLAFPPAFCYTDGVKENTFTGEVMLDKLNRINLLYDIYGSLLTTRQQEVLRLYFSDNYSLGEIAAEYGVSRQAIHCLLYTSSKRTIVRTLQGPPLYAILFS